MAVAAGSRRGEGKNDMKALVTGATGFVGSHLVERLLADGREVRCLVRRTSALGFLEGKDVELCLGDLAEVDRVERATEGVDTVFHCAALVRDFGRRGEFAMANVQGVSNLLEAACRKRVRRFVHLSTNDFYGRQNRLGVTEDTRPAPIPFAYSVTKREGEALVQQAHAERGLETVVLRPPTIYGPRAVSLILEIADLILRGDMVLVDHGAARAGLCYVTNLVDAMVLAAAAPAAAGQAYNVSDGSSATWKEFVDALSDLLGRPRVRRSMPYGLAYPASVAMEALWALLFPGQRPLLTRKRFRKRFSERGSTLLVPPKEVPPF